MGKVSAIIGDCSDGRPRRCSPVAFLHWRDVLECKCPECGSDEAFYWLDFSPGLYCANIDCEWDWIESDSTGASDDELAFMDDDYEEPEASWEEELEDLFDA